MENGTRISDLPDDLLVNDEKKVEPKKESTKPKPAVGNLLSRMTGNVDWTLVSVVGAAAFAGQTIPIDTLTSKFPALLSAGVTPLRSCLIVILFLILRALFSNSS